MVITSDLHDTGSGIILPPAHAAGWWSGQTGLPGRVGAIGEVAPTKCRVPALHAPRPGLKRRDISRNFVFEKVRAESLELWPGATNNPSTLSLPPSPPHTHTHLSQINPVSQSSLGLCLDVTWHRNRTSHVSRALEYACSSLRRSEPTTSQ